MIDASVDSAGSDGGISCTLADLASEQFSFYAEDRDCGAEQQRICAAAIGSLAEGAVGTCRARTPLCFNADACPLDDPPYCSCGGTFCSPGETCIQRPGARARCERACLSEPATPRECSAMSLSLPPVRASLFPDCDGDAQERCRLWAQAVAPSGYAHASCVVPSNAYCGMGRDCVEGEDSRRPACDCGGTRCRDNEVCISDTPSSEPRCVPACLE